jgi:hypothetical protein
MKSWLLILALGLSGCAHSIHHVHTSDFSPGAPIKSGDMVKGSAEQFVILGFVAQTDYVNQAYQKLLNACPNGAVTGITTQYSTALGFFSWTNKILMQGLCIRSSKSKS